MSGKIVTKELDRALQDALAPLGFRKSSPGTCCVSLSPEISGWVGVHSARPGDGSVEVAPMVGVHCVPVHKLIAEMRGEKYKSCDPPTFVRNAGYLMPERGKYIEVKFENAAQIPERVPVFVEIVRDVGLPFMRAHADIAAVRDSLVRFRSMSSFEERLAGAEFLLGNREGARRIVEEHLHTLQSQHAVVRQEFEKFAIPFLKRLDS